MTDHSELIARLEATPFSPGSRAGKDEREAAAALRELSKDAERYRWLRDDTMADDIYEAMEVLGIGNAAGLDAAIDAAMAAAKP